jgi:hypothetical protein
MNACRDEEEQVIYGPTIQRLARVCRDFVNVFFDRVTKDTTGAFDTIDLEAARDTALKKLEL